MSDSTSSPAHVESPEDDVTPGLGSHFNLLDMFVVLAMLRHRPENLTLFLWFWVGEQRNVRAIASCARAYLWASTMWCAVCHRDLVCQHRRLVSWPGSLPIEDLILNNSMCFCCRTVSQQMFPLQSRALELFFNHPRLCHCTGCMAAKQYGFVWI
jgi:hypothetical protein